MKDRKSGAPTSVLNEENESVDDGNPSPEIVEEDNSPTASSTSLNSSAHDNPLLLESQEPEVIDQSQAEGRDQAISGEGDQPPKPKDTSSVQFLTKDHASGEIVRHLMTAPLATTFSRRIVYCCYY